ncbi:MAG: sugar phosphate isomerase/epimerase [Lachnospiraceae bacterium]|nr:sugar phosphate isomerase/epimerase [Lachnospiraceae bacterium]
MKRKYSVELSNVGQYVDRYMACGYNDDYSIEQLFDRAKSVKKITGCELCGTWHITEKNVEQIRDLIGSHDLQLVSIIPDYFAQRKWGHGAFSSTDPAIRAEAIRDTKVFMDICADLGGEIVTVWNGQDGYDYPFTTNYMECRNWFRDAMKECANYRKDIKLSIEYKPREPKMRSFMSDASSTLLLVNEVNEENLGITLDFGHSIMGIENPAEAAHILKMYGDRLFHCHVNDNYGYWDDDCIAGTIHPIETTEYLYWVKRLGYDSWFSFDQYPYREDGRDALEEGIEWIETLGAVADSLDDDEVDEIIKKQSGVGFAKLIREHMLKAY